MIMGWSFGAVDLEADGVQGVRSATLRSAPSPPLSASPWNYSSLAGCPRARERQRVLTHCDQGRAAPSKLLAYQESFIGSSRTGWPGDGASMIIPLPTYMATCPMPL